MAALPCDRSSSSTPVRTGDFSPVKILLPIKGDEDEAYFQRAAAIAPLATAERIALAHVIDAVPRGDLEYGRERYLGHRSLPEGRRDELVRAEEDRASAALGFARHALRGAGVPDDRIEEIVLRGKPKETLRDLAERDEIELIVVRARGGKPGPHSLGKTARFLVDHAPHAVLVVR